ncbi:MAG: alpha-glucan family phosphorylase, partial [Candidatus Zixiibacteriota bacterium]
LWRIRNRKREQLINFVRKRFKAQLVRRGASFPEIQKAEKVFDPRALTIGLARRFSSYKRGNLIFADPERLNKILNNDRKPVQLIVSGKAHPLDTPGKEIIKKIISHANEDRFRDKIIFLEDYDISLAKVLVQGCDVWLNNPRRPLEASGTSGMKAAINGGLHLSVLDGWWAEAYNGTNGFKIGNADEIENAELQDKYDADMLYNTLEREVIPLFYSLNEIGLPAEWLMRMKSSIQTAGEFFSSQRMLMNYTDQFYVAAIEAGAKLSSDNFGPTRRLAAWLEQMSRHWDTIAIKKVDIPVAESELFVGQILPISVDVYLGEISPEDVRIELISGRLNTQEQIINFQPVI